MNNKKKNYENPSTNRGDMNFQSFYLETARQLCHVTFRAKFSAPLLVILKVKTFTSYIFPQPITHPQMEINYRT